MGFNAATYRLDTQLELFDIMDAAVAAVADGGVGITVEVEDNKTAKSLALRLHKFRLAYEEQTDDSSLKYAYAGLKIAPSCVDDFSGVSVSIPKPNSWKITKLVSTE